MPLFRLLLLLFSLAPSAVLALPANKPTSGYARVAVETSVGTMVIAVDLKRAPRTSANFLTYVDDGRFDGVTFYRAARRKSNPKLHAQAAGLGVGFLPSWIAQPAIDQGRLVPLKVAAPKPRLQLSVAWRPQGAGPAARWFVERLQQVTLG